MGCWLQVRQRPRKPVMVFDGDCGFCRRWIARWQEATGERVEYLPFQDPQMAARFPELPRERCEQSAQWIDTDGRVYQGAEAVLRSLAHAPGRRWLWWLYRRAPGFAPATEWAYRLVARHRGAASALTRWLWGTHLQRPRYGLVRWLFLRALGVIYLIAFVSLWTQATGLIGEGGILPVREYMTAARDWADSAGKGVDRYRLLPTLCWINDSNGFLHALCASGVVLSALLIAGIAPAPVLIVLWVLYLSLTVVGRDFLAYQWDVLLLETGLLAALFAPWQLLPRRDRESPPSRVALWLLRWLLFRLMFLSGAAKLLSGDQSWRRCTALMHHYETQPLPTWIGWHAHQLPAAVHRFSCALMFGIELVLPLLILAPRRLRFTACAGFVLLQLLIMATGNYCFFNLLTLALCLLLLDDAALRAMTPAAWRDRLGRRDGGGRGWPAWAIAPVAALVVALSTAAMINRLRPHTQWPEPVAAFTDWFAPLRSFNSYGLFAVMTVARPEIIIEGSRDGREWAAYEFKYKPGDPSRRPRFVAPHQPRLDWQMWFEALRAAEGLPPSGWFRNFCARLLEGSPDVLALMADNPFGEAPPRYLRAVLYDYRFTDFSARRSDGAWWRRERTVEYVPTVRLTAGGSAAD
jgi:predicted DCC family thiol-disulfide oxidoreductase YuxK